MEKWISTTDAQWQAVFKREVGDVHDAEINKLKQQYLPSLDTAINKATAASDLDGAVALRKEQKRFTESKEIPEQDEASEAPSVKQLRAAFRVQVARVEKESALRARSLQGKYDQVLVQAQAKLTQSKRLDDALLVKAKREEVAAAWITPAVVAAEKANPPATPLAQKAPATQTPTGGTGNSAAGDKIETIAELSGITVTGDQSAVSKTSFQVPVEVEYKLKTDGQVRFGYACRTMAFNWQDNPTELRIEGGPVAGQHKKGEGSLAKDAPVVVKVTVQRNRMVVSVDGRERAHWAGNFSTISQPLSISASHGSTVQIEQVTVRTLH